MVCALMVWAEFHRYQKNRDGGWPPSKPPTRTDAPPQPRIASKTAFLAKQVSAAAESRRQARASASVQVPTGATTTSHKSKSKGILRSSTTPLPTALSKRVKRFSLSQATFASVPVQLQSMHSIDMDSAADGRVGRVVMKDGRG